jgi:hypothetical protein
LSAVISSQRPEYENATGEIDALSEGRGCHDNRKPARVEEFFDRI